MREIYKDIKGYEGLYQISNCGNIKSLAKKHPRNRCNKDRILKPQISKKGYYIFNLSKNGKTKIHLLHRLLAEHFVKNINNFKIVNHIDGNKLNNDLNNLEWCSFADNVKHAYKNGLMKNCKKVGKYDANDNFIKEYYSINSASKENNINQSNISLCLLGKRLNAGGYKWKYINKGDDK